MAKGLVQKTVDEFKSFKSLRHIPLWLVLLLALIFLFRIPSFFDPYNYGDEMIYLKLGEAIRRGMVLYRDIHDNKPPLLYFTAAIAGNVFWFRVILAGWMMATTVAFWKLAGTLFKKENKIIIASTVVFAFLTTIPLLEGQVSNAELFMIGPTIIAFWILLAKKLTPDSLIEAGVFFAVGALFKIPSAFDVIAIVFFWVVYMKWNKKSITEVVKNTVFLSIGFAVPILITMVWYVSRGAGHEYLVAAYLQNLGYLSSWRPSAQQASFLVRNGPLLVRGAVVLVGFVVLYLSRKKLSKEFIFVCGWLLVSLFGVTLSERPYPHYLIQIVPSLSFLAGILIFKQSIEQSLSVLPILLILVAVQYFHFWHYPTFAYYQRFGRYITGQISKDTFYNEFDSHATRNYEIAAFIMSSSKPEDKVFIWGDSPTIYALSKRFPPIKYVATYHILDFSTPQEVMNKLATDTPRFIVILPNSPDFPQLMQMVANQYILIKQIGGASIYLSPTSSNLGSIVVQ